jgi:hypothetical protein
MKSLRKLTPWFRLFFAFLVFAIALALLIRGSSGPAAAHSPQASMAQDEEKSLDIPRYPNAPLELVDLKIHEVSVKTKINAKLKGNDKQSGLDNVRFREKDDWFKSIKLTLRNVSDKPIYGLTVNLLFQAKNLRMAFAVPITADRARDLRGHPLQPSQEIDLTVDAKGAQIFAYMYENGVDANQSSVQLSVEQVSFSDDFGWRKGVLMKRNPYDQRKWDVLDKPEPSPSKFLKLRPMGQVPLLPNDTFFGNWLGLQPAPGDRLSVG